MAEYFNSSNCPGTDVILELLRAEHDQVKQRTDIIKQLISFNCLSKSDAAKYKLPSSGWDTLNSSKNHQKSPFGNHSETLFNPSDQISFNNWASRHERCFLPYGDKSYTESSVKLKSNEMLKHIVPSSNKLLYNVRKEESRPAVPTYSAVVREDLRNLENRQFPTYSHFQKDIFDQSTPVKPKGQIEPPVKKPTFAQNGPNLQKKQYQNDKANKMSGNKTPANKAIANQTEANLRNNETGMNGQENYDYKFEAYKLLQEVADLKLAARKYEEEKSDWIHEKRQQVRILQELRDASCDETKAAMDLTNWKPSDIECNPAEYEDCKTKWLLCKKRQIELLEKLRGVSLCEIKRTVQKVAVPGTLDYDCSKLDERSKTCTEMAKSYSQELFNSDKIAVRICTPTQKNECFDKDKININIMMKSNSNVTKLSQSPTELSEPALKGSPCKSLRTDANNSGLFRDSNSSVSLHTDVKMTHFISDTDSNYLKNKSREPSISSQMENLNEIPIEELKKKIENNIGRKLFQNTYNLLKQLNCPELILQSTNGDAQIAETVFNYIIQERKLGEQVKTN